MTRSEKKILVVTMVGFAVFILLVGIFSPSENSMRYCVEYLTGKSIRGMDITKKNVDKALLNLASNLKQLGYEARIVEEKAATLARRWRNGQKMILVMFPRRDPEHRDPVFVVPIEVTETPFLCNFRCYTAKPEPSLCGETAESNLVYRFEPEDKIKGVIIEKSPKSS